MDWQKKLEQLQRDKEWDEAINLMKSIIAQNPNDVWAYIQAIYLLHNLLVEEDYAEDKQEDVKNVLINYFEKSRQRFYDNPDYLFFIGKILHIAEWYFGQSDNTLAFSFQEKALKLNPDNVLYQWAYHLSLTGSALSDRLAHQIISSEEGIVSWLKTKGFPGKYVLEHLGMGNGRYESNK